MRRLPCALLLALCLVACGQKEPADKSSVNELARHFQVESGDAADRVVPMNGPSTVHVRQNGRVVFIHHWPHQRGGQVTVPISAIDDGSGPLTIDVWPGPLADVPQFKYDGSAGCSACMRGALYRCCPKQ
jgi:hypothetical protein